MQTVIPFPNSEPAAAPGAALVRYDTMCQAIAAAYEVDEVKEIRDKAAALEHYAHQAKNTELERQCAEIRLRAERKAGELLRQMEKAKGAPGNQHTGPMPRGNGSKTLADYGVTPKQSSQWQKLARVPEAKFEAALAAIEMSTLDGILRSSKDPSAERGQPKREGADFWPTPDSLIQAAVAHMMPALPVGPLWECACGDGRLGRAIDATYMTDKYPQDGTRPLDFLTDDPPAPGLIAFTNQPFNAADEFLYRGLELIDTGVLRGLVLLLRHDHFMASGKTEALNRALFEVHCNWRPTWIPNTDGSPRWAFAWVYWGPGDRCPPLYVREE